MTEFVDDQGQLAHAAELREASDLFIRRLDRLSELETRKRELSPDAPEFVRLAREIEDMARALLYAGGEQVELAETVHHEARQNDTVIDQPIRDTLPKRDAVAILADWRAAERRLAAAPIGSEEEAAARGDVERLRNEYRLITAPTANDPDA